MWTIKFFENLRIPAAKAKLSVETACVLVKKALFLLPTITLLLSYYYYQDASMDKATYWLLFSFVASVAKED